MGTGWLYLARIKDTIYVLHCFEKDTAKTEKRDLSIAEKAMAASTGTAERGAEG